MLCGPCAEGVAWLPHFADADCVAGWPQAAGEARAPKGDEANAADAPHACSPAALLPNGDADEPAKLLPNGDCPRVVAAELPKGVLFSAWLAASSEGYLFGAAVALGIKMPKGEAAGAAASAGFCPNGEADRVGAAMARGAVAVGAAKEESMEESPPPSGEAAAPHGEAADPEGPTADALNGEATGACDAAQAPNGEAAITPLPAATPCGVVLAPNGEAATPPQPAPPPPPPNGFAAAAPLP